MPRNEDILPIREFLGVNKRDGGEKARINEFLKLQNFFQKNKGVLQRVYGSSDDLTAAQIPGANRITAIHRHPVAPCPNAKLYHCTPTSTPITHPDDTGLTITEVTSASGTIFDAAAAASRQVRFCYSYIGMGVESSWDTRTRPGFIQWSGTDISAWDQPGLQTFTLASATNTLQVSHPTAFPTDVRAVNVFMSIGDSTDGAARRELVYVGTLNSNSDVLDVDVSIGSSAAASDTFTTANIQVEARRESDGDFPAGQYYVALAWVNDGQPHDEFDPFRQFVVLSEGIAVQVKGTENAIGIHYYQAGAASTNGATHCYVFIGIKPPTEGPMTCVGSFRIGSTGRTSGNIDTFVIKKVPYNRNAASTAYGSSPPVGYFKHIPHQRNAENMVRHGFIVKKDPDREVEITEVFPSRSGWSFFGPVNTTEFDYHLIRTSEDRNNGGNPPSENPNLVEPSFTYFNGASYMANGRDFQVTDGVSITRMVAKDGCVIPEAPVFLFTFKNQLVCTTAEGKGVPLGSNALQANNWSDGGTGTAYRFAILGDPFESRLTAANVFSKSTEENDPTAFLLFFKKNSIFALPNIPDATSGINYVADTISGSVGCLAWRSIVQTKLGVIFLGSDGDFYLIRGSGEPLPIGSKVKEEFKHLVANESLMKKCVAVRHGDYYKIAYPSSSSSTTNDAEYWADLRTEDGTGILWYGPHTGRAIGAQIVLNADEDGGERIAALADAAGAVQMDDESVDTHGGTSITPVLETTLRRLASEFNLKKFKGLFIEAYYDTTIAQSILIEAFSDAEYTQKTVTLSEGDADAGEARWRRHIEYFDSDNLVGSDVKIRITHTGDTQFTISALGIPYKPERRLAI